MQKRKSVLITGGTGGIGNAIASVFAKKGYDIILQYHKNEEKADKIKKNLESLYSIKVKPIKCDISKEEEVKNLATESINTFTKIDVLVNNAAISLDSVFEKKNKETFTKTLEVNLIGAFLMSKYIGEYMIKRKEGTMIQIASTNGMGDGHPMSLEYDASKAALISLSHNLAIQYAPYIRVNTVSPGWVETDMVSCDDAELEALFRQEESQKIYLGRFASPIEIANVVYFLASKEASYVNDAVIKVDGGFRC